ncbi:MAG: hypothetical protein WAM14_07680 [Candidatus Nitrosopolaris sp.]
MFLGLKWYPNPKTGLKNYEIQLSGHLWRIDNRGIPANPPDIAGATITFTATEVSGREIPIPSLVTNYAGLFSGGVTQPIASFLIPGYRITAHFAGIGALYSPSEYTATVPMW